ncbi:hypothetical protein ASPWEDRAFT_656387 [Aspergillus wentii DTO 134E9]|uniref:Uncharacterized protein n=1 Tax=Aspergillus wentii DTO 134E9 TaxID=1073089 RepID=A0A1L9RBG7_ASPWE|nr:uncharacterized protein ASPWEDRAFT_656387 [Aspergillus wentii DTO 134E9]OJJ32264.1 hypothetical protein ASPWEDRAFT_656387 [Aspergillus wentii DTO 134E9]
MSQPFNGLWYTTMDWPRLLLNCSERIKEPLSDSHSIETIKVPALHLGWFHVTRLQDFPYLKSLPIVFCSVPLDRVISKRDIALSSRHTHFLSESQNHMAKNVPHSVLYEANRRVCLSVQSWIQLLRRCALIFNGKKMVSFQKRMTYYPQTHSTFSVGRYLPYLRRSH